MASYLPVVGSKQTPLANSRSAGPIDPNELASVTVRVRSKGAPGALGKLAYQLALTPLAQRRYLTHQDLLDQHGASAADLDAVEKFAQSQNLVVVHRSALERCVVLKGSLGDLLRAFRADVQLYHHPHGTYRALRGEIHVLDSLVPIITGVFGLDTRPRQRSPFRLGSASHAGPGSGNGVSAADFAKRYNFPANIGATALDGTGQTIGIIELGGGFQDSDLQVFFQEVGLPAPGVVSVSVDHAGNSPSSADSADGEVMLDIEVAGAVVPGATIAVYFAPNNGDQGFIDAISAAVHDTERKPGVISISWGSPESASDAQGIKAFHDIFAAAGALGITICVASGDHGTADLSAPQWDQKIHVDHPACDDLVLACGGTQVDPDSGADVVWNDGTPFDVTAAGGGGWASGGGISTVFAVPDYQAQNIANMPVSIDTKQPGRGVPDIAMSATNYFTRVDTMEGPSGGTSAVAPLMAALVARLNQAKQKNVGFLNPLLYANATGPGAVVVDVVSGTNAIANTVSGYQAGPGWDACSGLGTPDGTALLKMLA